ncbi:MAG: ABC transporter permease subunit [Alphaproteobacteria bacterium]|jgi:general L-amino acid transport system permease protein|nr:ABC transporter permease subunit [Alphaproteobacteria bacterium]MEC7202693.1 ABC transporter permease subunit [Pseudomonadota bacterium]MEC7397127.1 ABC transporter permease subunit [Pseudomonadota bacterium]MEC7537467.1 ABC transporter permease subunit [Pseudomonadota bacterium]MEC7648697.1 ABC transporter permease subunit [Pseudomonadota bacterium]|tara:strand:- start:4877 stop:6085 length:1209 start_codon:yes stop_codon:yes gene_type:complete
MAVDVKDGGTPSGGGARWWYDPKVRAIIFQVTFVVALVVFIAFIVNNTVVNLEKRDIRAGFGFLSEPAGFEIPITGLVDYSVDKGSTHGAVFLIGLQNTFLISAMGIVLATILGFILGVLRLSNNWIVTRLVGSYIEIVRNIPLPLQFIFWQTAVFIIFLPKVRDPISIFDTIYIHNRGFTGPKPIGEANLDFVFYAIVVAIGVVMWLRKWARRRQDETGEQFPVLWTSLGILIGLPLLVAAILGFPLSWEYAELGRFRFTGGMGIPIELFSALTALTIYTSAFIAEIVRAGILSVSRGQMEASHALGIRHGPTLRLVIIPQALRVIIPPLISQYLNLTKNSSLGILIGYSDLFNVFGGISLNQTGQAIEIIFMSMSVYLCFSLLISLYMNWYNRRIALTEH